MGYPQETYGKRLMTGPPENRPWTPWQVLPSSMVGVPVTQGGTTGELLITHGTHHDCQHGHRMYPVATSPNLDGIFMGTSWGETVTPHGGSQTVVFCVFVVRFLVFKRLI